MPPQDVQVLGVVEHVRQLEVHAVQTRLTEAYPEGHESAQVLLGFKE